MNSSTFGKAGEEAVARYLEKRRYVIIATNYASNGGEIDIVAYKFGVLVFVEVKTRSSTAFGTPSEAVTEGKKQRIKKAAEGFEYEQVRFGKVPVWSSFFDRMTDRKIRKTRFDIAEVYCDRNLTAMKIEYNENAF